MAPKKRKSEAGVKEAAADATSAAAGAVASKDVKSEDCKDASNGSNSSTKEIVNALCHLEIPAHDLGRVSEFYKSVFGWKCSPYGEEYFMFSNDGIGGGFYKTNEPIGKGKSISPALFTKSVDTMVPLIHAAGGVITRPNTLIHESVGSWLGFNDTEGNPMSLFTKQTTGLIETATVEQRVLLGMSAHDAYETIFDGAKHTLLNGTAGDAKTACVVDRRINGAFSVMNGWIHGRTIEYETDKRIVQSWNAKDFPANHYSNVSFQFEDDAKSNGCWVTLKHQFVPKDKATSLSNGWCTFYWNSMKLVRVESSTPAQTTAKPVAAAAPAGGPAPK